MITNNYRTGFLYSCSCCFSPRYFTAAIHTIHPTTAAATTTKQTHLPARLSTHAYGVVRPRLMTRENGRNPSPCHNGTFIY